jgi:tetratricopeptide (TPR) repeat protein
VIKADSSQADVFQHVYGKSLKQVQDDLVSYMRGTRFNAGLVDVKLEKSAESPDVRTATGLESGLALADLLAVTRKRKEAGAAYESLARDYPKEPEIPVAMARLAWMNSDREEMKRQFAKAIELGTKNAKVYTDYAAMLQQANAPSAEIAEILGKALELDSGLVEARYRLGLVLISESRFGEAAIQLSQVKKLEKQMASPYYQALSYAHYRLGMAELARTEAANAVKYAVDEGQTKRAQDLVTIVSREPSKAPSAPPVETADGRPHLARREAQEEAPPPVARPREQTYPVEGMLQQVDCLGNVARLRVLAGNKPFTLLIEDPQRVTIKSSGADGVHEFTCGAQKPARVAIEYIPKPDSKYQTEGTIRSLEFR